MSTRAVIATRMYDETILATYLHFDGYPERILPILNEGYLDPDEALDLVQGGELRLLEPRPAEPEYFEDGRPVHELNSDQDLPGLARQMRAGHIYFYDNVWQHREV
ncbi:hypothetical protein [Crateriforma spongiae]|uniref:hypothetical protein n=1 Tax=Crateriforma spongiae TaxID=2724528 RepID=UPI0039B0E5D9